MGSSCAAAAVAQTRSCADGVVGSWQPEPPAGTQLYEACTAKCAAGCNATLRGDGSPNMQCNVASCCYDNGDVEGWARSQLLSAAMTAMAGKAADAAAVLTPLCNLTKTLPSLIGASSAAVVSGDAALSRQLGLFNEACRAAASLADGRDFFGAGARYVEPVAWTSYVGVVEERLTVLQVGELPYLMMTNVYMSSCRHV